jgi:hypothetical protein
MMRRCVLAMVVSLAQALCASTAFADTPEAGVGMKSDPAAALYDPGRMVGVDIQIDDDAWNVLCSQKRTFVSLFRGACFAQPFPSPFTWQRARVVIDGIARDNAGIRKKGFLGSLDGQKPSLKISLTEFVDNDPVYGLKKLTLNNAKQDPSLVRQCLGYQLFLQAGLPAPRCNFAHVRVNGRSLGVYVNVEEVRKPMLARHFADTSGNLYEGTVSDFHPLLLATFEAQTNESSDTHAALAAVTAALAVDDGVLLERLGAVIDLDAFVTFWAMEALVGQWDGYSSNRNNYYAYQNPASGKLHFIPWGADTVLGDGYPIASLDPGANKAVFAYSAITRRLVDIPSMRARYDAVMHRLLDTVWREQPLLAEIDRMQALLQPIAGDLAGATAPVRAFVTGQRTRILAGLAGNPVFPALTILDLCLVENGSIAGAFVAEWGTSGVVPPFQAGAAGIDASVAGAAVRSSTGGADAGLFPAHPNPHEGQLNLYLHTKGTPLATVMSTVDPARLVPGAHLRIDGQEVDAAFVPLDGHSGGGFLDAGTLHLHHASTLPGGKICGTFEAKTYTFALTPLTSGTRQAAAPPAATPAVASVAWQRELMRLMQQCQPGSPR